MPLRLELSKQPIHLQSQSFLAIASTLVIFNKITPMKNTQVYQ